MGWQGFLGCLLHVCVTWRVD